MIHDHFWLYLLVTAGTTYLVRMLPLVLMRKKTHTLYVNRVTAEENTTEIQP